MTVTKIIQPCTDDSLLTWEQPANFEEALKLLSRARRDLEKKEKALQKYWCQSCFNTGYIDSDGICGNCDLGRAKGETLLTKEILRMHLEKYNKVVNEATKYRWLRDVADRNRVGHCFIGKTVYVTDDNDTEVETTIEWVTGDKADQLIEQEIENVTD